MYDKGPVPGRNDACWCGSGKKYKKCHSAFDERLERARNLARNDPKMVANLIKEWMGVNEEARK